MVNEAEDLGHLVSSKAVPVDEQKAQAITDWPKRRIKRDVQSFLTVE